GVDLGHVALVAAIAVVAIEPRHAPQAIAAAVEVPVFLHVGLGEVADRVLAQGHRAVGLGQALVGVGVAHELVELVGRLGEAPLEVERPGHADEGLVVELALGIGGGLGVGLERGVELVEVVVHLAHAQPGLGRERAVGLPGHALAVVAAAEAAGRDQVAAVGVGGRVLVGAGQRQ